MIDPNAYNFLSNLEKKVYDWLTKNNIPFNTQQTMFGPSSELGSATVDFVLPDRNIVLRVMGSFWHSGLQASARDLLGRERLIGAGYIVVDLQEADLTDDKIEGTMRLALQGREMLK